MLRGQADERVAAEALAADDGFEQERVARVGELDVERQRRVEVRERLEDERDAVISLRGQRAEFGFGHGASTVGCDAGNGSCAVLRGVACRRATPGANGQRRQRRQRRSRAATALGRRPAVRSEEVEAHWRIGVGRRGARGRRPRAACGTIPSASRFCTGTPLVVAVGQHQHRAAGGARRRDVVARVADHQQARRRDAERRARRAAAAPASGFFVGSVSPPIDQREVAARCPRARGAAARSASPCW